MLTELQVIELANAIKRGENNADSVAQLLCSNYQELFDFLAQKERVEDNQASKNYIAGVKATLFECSHIDLMNRCARVTLFVSVPLDPASRVSKICSLAQELAKGLQDICTSNYPEIDSAKVCTIP